MGEDWWAPRYRLERIQSKTSHCAKKTGARSELPCSLRCGGTHPSWSDASPPPRRPRKQRGAAPNFLVLSVAEEPSLVRRRDLAPAPSFGLPAGPATTMGEDWWAPRYRLERIQSKPRIARKKRG